MHGTKTGASEKNCCCLCLQVSLLLLPSVDDFEEQLLAALAEDLGSQVSNTAAAEREA